jgi:hypothetical protein
MGQAPEAHFAMLVPSRKKPQHGENDSKDKNTNFTPNFGNFAIFPASAFI